MEIDKADQAYCDARKALLEKYDLKLFAISSHLVGQCVADNIDERHKSIVPDYIWGDGYREGVRQRAVSEVVEIIRALNDIGYNGPLSVEWEDSGMDREAGAEEACDFVRFSDFTPSDVAFDDAMQKE